MASYRTLLQRRAALIPAAAKARRCHRKGAGRLARELVATTTELLRAEVNAARIAPARAARRDTQPTLF